MSGSSKYVKQYRALINLLSPFLLKNIAIVLGNGFPEPCIHQPWCSWCQSQGIRTRATCQNQAELSLFSVWCQPSPTATRFWEAQGTHFTLPWNSLTPQTLTGHMKKIRGDFSKVILLCRGGSRWGRTVRGVDPVQGLIPIKTTLDTSFRDWSQRLFNLKQKAWRLGLPPLRTQQNQPPNIPNQPLNTLRTQQNPKHTTSTGEQDPG